MRPKTLHMPSVMRAVLPYLWGVGLAVALDHVIDVQTLFLPVLAGVAVVSAGCLMLRKAQR